ncbi:cobalt ECF transporter T component CbiQ [Brevibacillus ginsengisoli]|uniref:cobalt ECF transporter T component CbiQ n=1 Tax=Brevibacillus ginsengisoli TaxID=363854 RepID=UPI003CF38A79
MFLIDKYSYTNRLRSIHPLEKALLSLSMLIISMFAREASISIMVFLIASIIILLAKIPWRFYLKLLCLPLAFILTGLVTVIFQVTTQASPVDGAIGSWQFAGLTIYTLPASLKAAYQLFFVATSSVSCLFLLILTTPLADILYLLKRLHVSPVLLEIIAFSYRFVFILFDTSRIIYQSQASRLGYSTFRQGIHSLGGLSFSLFMKSMQKATKMHEAIESRGGYGDFTAGEIGYVFSVRNWFMIFGLLFLLIFLYVR